MAKKRIARSISFGEWTEHGRSEHGNHIPATRKRLCLDSAASPSHVRLLGCVAAGATFKTLGRKQTPQGKAVITRHLDDLDAAEAAVNDIYFTWRKGQPTRLDAELNSMLARWRDLQEGDELVVKWPLPN